MKEEDVMALSASSSDRESPPRVTEKRSYPLPEAVRVTLCPLDQHPTPRGSACWSFCGENCWVTYRDGRA